MSRHWSWISPIFLFGCATFSPLQASHLVNLAVYPQVNPYTQSIVPNYTLSSIATLSILPYIETTPNTYAPISTVTGNPTTVDAQDVLRLYQASPSIDPTVPFVIRRLKPNSKYRILARAYDSSNALISKDASSYTDVTLTNDDAPAVATIPVNLVDVPFGATTSISLNTQGRFDYLKGTLYLVTGNAQVGVSTTSRVNPDFSFGNLQSNTNYRLLVEAYKLGSMVASQSLNFNVGNDNAPASQSMSLTVPYIVSTLAGSTVGTADGVGTAAQFNRAIGVAVDRTGNVYVSDANNHHLRKITPTGVVSTFAGSSIGTADGPGTAAQFGDFYGGGVCDAAGNLYIADTGNNRIRKVTPAGDVSTFAGSAVGYADGTGLAAQFYNPFSVAMDASGNLYVADTFNQRIRKITPAGVVSTLAGNGTIGTDDGNASLATFYYPEGIAVDPTGNVYVSDCYNHRIRKISTGGVVSTLAGSTNGFADGTGTSAKFYYPRHITIDDTGNIYVADETNNRIRKITPAGVVTTMLGVAATGSVDGLDSVARFYQPWDVEFDGAGALYIADTYNNRIRLVR